MSTIGHIYSAETDPDDLSQPKWLIGFVVEPESMTIRTGAKWHLFSDAEHAANVEEMFALNAYTEDIREAALEVGGVDHTADAAAIIRELAAQRNAVHAVPDPTTSVDDARYHLERARASLLPRSPTPMHQSIPRASACIHVEAALALLGIND